MRTFQAPIGPDGALVDVLIRLAEADVQRLRAAGQPVPPPVAARALLDIGAEASCVDRQLIAPLPAAGVKPRRFVFTHFSPAGQLSVVSEYAVGLTIVHPSADRRANLVLRNQTVLEQSLDPLEYRVLIGRDVLSRCLLVYDGSGQRITLAY